MDDIFHVLLADQWSDKRMLHKCSAKWMEFGEFSRRVDRTVCQRANSISHALVKWKCKQIFWSACREIFHIPGSCPGPQMKRIKENKPNYQIYNWKKSQKNSLFSHSKQLNIYLAHFYTTHSVFCILHVECILGMSK